MKTAEIDFNSKNDFKRIMTQEKKLTIDTPNSFQVQINYFILYLPIHLNNNQIKEIKILIIIFKFAIKNNEF